VIEVNLKIETEEIADRPELRKAIARAKRSKTTPVAALVCRRR
jgi:hypothetical protein